MSREINISVVHVAIGVSFHLHPPGLGRFGLESVQKLTNFMTWNNVKLGSISSNVSSCRLLSATVCPVFDWCTFSFRTRDLKHQPQRPCQDVPQYSQGLLSVLVWTFRVSTLPTISFWPYTCRRVVVTIAQICPLSASPLRGLLLLMMIWWQSYDDYGIKQDWSTGCITSWAWRVHTHRKS